MTSSSLFGSVMSPIYGLLSFIAVAVSPRLTLLVSAGSLFFVMCGLSVFSLLSLFVLGASSSFFVSP